MSTALYRRYRPETFAEVIGQDHVTGPLMQALRTGRVTHAYLFSGPRGCGKTTSARILARTLNCVRNTPESPTDTPCSECPSCVELARGGPGSLDVVEIDAASHGGVDDARDLRERATFAPTRDRFKIFIIDEAHMVSSAGFNALLKIVEEPPPHIKFVFATTEPDKVIGTIRSRTHHYPFRLVPPDVLGPYLEELSTEEGIEIGSGVVPLVTRAGGGSVRDSLSVLDQLIAGANDRSVDYERAIALLGFTGAALLDDVMDALAARDGASIFRVVDHVISSGHEPRRFVEDVLERLRDLIVMAVSGEAADAVLRDLPTDQLARMRTQAANLGMAELSRAADLANAALTEMTGATSPRLHLELLCARLLLPGADDRAAGFAARLDRLERGGLSVAPSGAAGSVGPESGAAGALTGAAAARAALYAARRAPEPEAARPAPALRPPTSDSPLVSTRQAAEPSGPASESASESAPEHAPEPALHVAPPMSGSSPMTTEDVRHRWDEVLDTLRSSRVTWSLVRDNAQVAELAGETLVLAFTSEALARTFSVPRHIDAMQDAIYQTIGLRVRVEARSGPAGPDAPGRRLSEPVDASAPGAGTSRSPDAPAQAHDAASSRAADPNPAADRAPAVVPPVVQPTKADAADEAWLAGLPAPEPPADLDDSEEPPPGPPVVASPTPFPLRGADAARAAVRGSARLAGEVSRKTEHEAAGPSAAAAAGAAVDPYDEPSADDPDLASAGLVGVPLVVQTLGGTVIEERIEAE